MTEAQFQRAVLDLARLLGWRVAHFRAARTAQGWRTPVAADGAGFPDLLMCRGDRIVAAELKAAGGRVRPDQEAWLAALGLAGAEVHVWRPSQFGEVEAVLR